MTETIKNLVEAIEARCYGTGVIFEAVEVPKNNGLVRQAIQVRTSGSCIGKLVYVENILEMMENNELDLEEAAEEFEEVYRQTEISSNETVGGVQKFMQNVAADKEQVLDNVRHTVVNKKWNEKMLESLPHRDYLDLAVIYEVSSNLDDGSGSMSAKVTYNMMEHYGISVEELEEAAKKNKREFEADDLIETLLSQFPEGSPEREMAKAQFECAPECYQFVVSTKDRLKGATALLHTEIFEEIAQKAKRDLFIIPSSVHEVIAMPFMDGMEPEEVTRMVQEVNETQLLQDEKLSDHVYIYKLGSNEITF